MALVRCVECGRDISEHAAICPQCGYPSRPRPWTHRAFKILIAIAALIFIGMFVLSLALAWFTRKPFEIDLPQADLAPTSALQDTRGPLA